MADRVKRVVDGNLAETGLPWMAHIRNGKSYCSGALIGDRWLMTARHCVMNKGHPIPAKDIHYSLFDPDRNRTPFRNIDEVYIYPGYAENPIVDGLTDFALIKTKEIHNDVDKLELNLEFVPDSEIMGLNRDSTENAKYSYIAGWGYTRPANRVSVPKLHWGVTPLQQMTQLVKHFANKNSSFQDHHFDDNSYLLAGNYNSDFLDDCFGDSGGPIWLSNSITSTKATAIGIAIGSTSSGCGKSGDLGIYLRLSVVKDFIHSTIELNSQ